MKRIMQRTLNAVILGLALLATQTAFAYYNPSTGRFLSRDPVGEPGFQVLQTAQAGSQVGPVAISQQSSRWISRDLIGKSGNNPYRYVLNDPVDYLDPDGQDTWVPYPYPGHYVSDPPPPPPQYPDSFAMCRRNVNVDGPTDVVGMVANCCGGEHTYMQYVSQPQPPAQGPPFIWGWGFSGGTTATQEGAFNPDQCTKCKKNGSPLMFGSGAGKGSTSATDNEIMDCIKNRKPDRRYSYPKYVCSDWAKQAAHDCGLTCK